MKKYFIYKILPVCLILFTGSCTGENSTGNSINCVQEYKKITQQIESKSKTNNLNAENTASSLLSSCAKHTGLRITLADINIAKGDNPAALKYIDDALKIEPNNHKAIHVKGVILSLLGKVDLSLEMLKKSLDLEPNNIDYLVNYCSTLESFTRYEDAIKICSRATQHNKVPPVVYFLRGRSYEAIGKNKDAQRDYDKAKKLGFNMWPK